MSASALVRRSRPCGPDGSTMDRVAMERYIRDQHASIVDIDPATSVLVSDAEVHGDTATVRTHQRFIRRIRLPDGSIVERRHWATHREEWVRTADGWRYRGADVIRQGRIAPDGLEEETSS